MGEHILFISGSMGLRANGYWREFVNIYIKNLLTTQAAGPPAGPARLATWLWLHLPVSLPSRWVVYSEELGSSQPSEPSTWREIVKSEHLPCDKIYISFFDQSCRDALPCKKIDDIFTKIGLLKGSKKVILFFLSKPQKRIKNKKTWILKWIIREGFKKKLWKIPY